MDMGDQGRDRGYGGGGGASPGQGPGVGGGKEDSNASTYWIRLGYPDYQTWFDAGMPTNVTYSQFASAQGGGGGGRPGRMGVPGSLEDAWQPGAAEATQIYNSLNSGRKGKRRQRQMRRDYRKYLRNTMDSLMELQDPSMNPYLDEMYNIGAENLRNEMFNSLGSSGRGRPIYDVGANGQPMGNDVFANYVDNLSNFGTQFYGNAYNQDMDRALSAGQAMMTMGPSVLDYRNSIPYADLNNYADIVSRLTGSSGYEPAEPEGSNNLMQAVGTGIAAYAAFASSEDFKDKTGETKGALAGIKSLDTDRWRYNDNAPAGTDRAEHAGPYAEQFHQAFGLGDGKSIHPIDAHGVQFAAIKELAAEVDRLKKKRAA